MPEEVMNDLLMWAWKAAQQICKNSIQIYFMWQKKKVHFCMLIPVNYEVFLCCFHCEAYNSLLFLPSKKYETLYILFWVEVYMNSVHGCCLEREICSKVDMTCYFLQDQIIIAFILRIVMKVRWNVECYWLLWPTVFSSCASVNVDFFMVKCWSVGDFLNNEYRCRLSGFFLCFFKHTFLTSGKQYLQNVYEIKSVSAADRMSIMRWMNVQTLYIWYL